jgi:hypothetical protein
MSKIYLGDGVYAEFDGYHIVLTTENGIETTNTIYLEPPVVRGLEEFIKGTNKSRIRDDLTY